MIFKTVGGVSEYFRFLDPITHTGDTNNYVTLDSKLTKPLPKQFTMCNSIEISYFKGTNYFMSVLKEDDKFWFSLRIFTQNLHTQTYTVFFHLENESILMEKNSMDMR